MFPGEIRVVATKVTEGSGLLVDGATQLEVTNDATRAEIEVIFNNLQNFSVRLDTSAVGVDVDREGLGNTDGVRDLDESALAELGSDEGLGDPTGSISSRAIDLGGVLAGEGTTTVSTPTTVAVNNDLAASQTSITLRTTDDEATRGVQVVDSLIVEVLGGDGGLDNALHQTLADLLVGNTVVVLSGDDNSVDAFGDQRTVVVLLVLNGDLSLGVRAQPLELTRAANNGETLAELSGEAVSEGHHFGGLIRGITEHVTLLSSRD